MSYFVYLIATNHKNKIISYVGYTNNVKKRLSLHNSNKGAKFTKGRKWKLLYKKRFPDKITAMKEEFILKKNFKLRNKFKKKFMEKII